MLQDRAVHPASSPPVPQRITQDGFS